jgi:hypothetical protein
MSIIGSRMPTLGMKYVPLICAIRVDLAFHSLMLGGGAVVLQRNCGPKAATTRIASPP